MKIVAQKSQLGVGRQLQETQSHVNEVVASVRALLGIDWLQGAYGTVVVGGVATNALAWTSGQSLTIAHTLGRPYRGYLILNAKGTSPSFTVVPASTASALSTAIVIKSTNAATGSVWVY